MQKNARGNGSTRKCPRGLRHYSEAFMFHSVSQGLQVLRVHTGCQLVLFGTTVGLGFSRVEGAGRGVRPAWSWHSRPTALHGLPRVGSDTPRGLLGQHDPHHPDDESHLVSCSRTSTPGSSGSAPKVVVCTSAEVISSSGKFVKLCSGDRWKPDFRG